MADIRLFLSLCLFFEVGHWLFDFVLQTEFQAINKSKDWRALSRHVATYGAGLLLMFTLWWRLLIDAQPALFDGHTVAYSRVLIFVVFNTAVHWGTDFITSRFNAALAKIAWAVNLYHDFFVGVGLDQMVHRLVFLFSAAWLLS